jgi:hypothetical protein
MWLFICPNAGIQAKIKNLQLVGKSVFVAG